MPDVNEQSEKVAITKTPSWDVDLGSRDSYASLDTRTASEKPLELDEDDFVDMDPEGVIVLRDLGVQKLTITQGDREGQMHVVGQLKAEKTKTPDPAQGGIHEIKIAPKFSGDITYGADGTITIENIKGITGKADGPFGIVARGTLTRAEISKTVDGKTELTATAKIDLTKRSMRRTAELDGSVADDARALFKAIEPLYKRHQQKTQPPSWLPKIEWRGVF